MTNSSKIAYDIIIKLAEETEKNTDLGDPYIQKLILELNAIAQINYSNSDYNQEHYTVKDVAELFDVNKQTVYKWIAEDKIEYKTDDSPGKIHRKGYQIPKSQFREENKVNEIDPTFRNRRENELEEIPNTGFNPK